jgi:hypothetical protein
MLFYRAASYIIAGIIFVPTGSCRPLDFKVLHLLQRKLPFFSCARQTSSKDSILLTFAPLH